MEPPGGRDSRFNLGYSMNLLSGETAPEIYGNPSLGRPSTSLQQLSPRHTMVSSACGGRGLKSDMYDERGMSSQGMGLEACVNDISEDTYSSLQSKKSPPSNGKKTKGRVKIKMEYIENKLRRYTTFSKRKTGIMKKAYELSTLTGTQVMLLVASETGHVYTFATRKLQPMITSEAGKALIQTCLNSPDPPAGSAGGDQRMSATGFEETELTYNISDEDSKEDGDDLCAFSSSSEEEEPPEDNSDLPEEIYLPSDPPLFPPTLPDRVLYKDEPPSKKTVENKSSFESSSSSETHSRKGSAQAKKCSNFVSCGVTQIEPSTSAVSSATSSLVTIASTVVASPTMITSSSALTSVTSSGLPTTSSFPFSTEVGHDMQAVPLLLQTASGVGYAKTPEGMILGFLQGPNLAQPQLVAIPVPRAGSAAGQTVVKKEANSDTC